MKDLLNKFSHIGVLKSDNEDEVQKKVALTLLPLFVSMPALLWSVVYFYLGYYNACAIPMSYIVVSTLSLIILSKTKKFFFFEITQLLLILILPFVLMWTLGGFIGGSFVMVWAFYAPIAAMMYSENVKSGFIWLSVFLTLVLFSIIIDDSLSTDMNNYLPLVTLKLFFIINMGGGFIGVFFLISQFVKNIKVISAALKKEKEALYRLTNDLKSANLELEHLATCDVVTELPNRLYFQDIVYDMFRRAQLSQKIVAIMFLDLDGFKSVNDTLGHDAGDEILRMVATRLKSSVRASDTVARVGGDEFAIAIGDITDVEHVKEIAKTIIKEVNEHCPYKDHKCHVGVSIGISFYPDHGNDIEELMKRADEAMYEIKKKGKNNYLIYKQD